MDVTAQKTELSTTGKKIIKLDTTVKQQFIFNSVGDALSLNSSVFIKNYGPGSLASTSLRGGNASQTAVIWNGFNIQNTMLGQADLSLLPSVLFENISVEYGGSSSLWGTGAVAGSIHLDNSPRFNKGFTSKVNVSGGSFGLFNTSTNLEFSKAKFFSSTKAYLQNSVNNYKYKDTTDKEQPIRNLTQSTYSFKGVMQELKIFLTSKQLLSVNAWYNYGQRQIPSFNTKRSVPPTQKDENLKTTINWNYLGKKYNGTIKGAFFNDVIIYNDDLLSINSKGTVRNLIFENENIFDWHKNNKLNFGLNVTSGTASSNNYSGTKNLNKAAFLAGNRFSFADKKLALYPVTRIEYFSVGKIQFTGNISLEYKPFKNITAKINSARVYRQPTFNELYWQPGGNPNLLPEQGYTCEGDLSYNKQINNLWVSVSGSLFNRVIDNWILWLPGTGSSPTPVNIQQVWSRGTETVWKINYQKNKFRILTNVFTAYTLSTVNSSSQESGNTIDRQLIYTPRYSVNGNITFGYANYSLTYYHQYIGYRFTASDNSQWLSPYHYSSLRFNMRANIGSDTDMILYAACNNLFNTNYSIVAGRFMPLRNFEIGISLINNKQNKKTKT